MGKIELALGVVGNHKAIGLHTRPGSRGALDEQVGFGAQLEFENQIGSGAQTGPEN